MLSLPSTLSMVFTSPNQHTTATRSLLQGQDHPSQDNRHLHSQSSTSANMSSALFQLINFPSRLVLDNVYLNGLHSLRRFGIANTSTTDIVVKMRSSLGSQISFQLTNENLPFEPELSGGSLSVISTNTAAAAEAGSSTATGHQFNQLFNHVNLIDEVTIPAGQTEYIILGFLPDPLGRNRRSNWDSGHAGTDVANSGSGNGSTHGDGVQVYDDGRQREMSTNGQSALDDEEFTSNDQQTDNFDSFEVNGLVFFFAYKVTSSTQSTQVLTRQDSNRKEDTSPDGPVNPDKENGASSAESVSLDPSGDLTGGSLVASTPSSLPPPLNNQGTISSTELAISSSAPSAGAPAHKADYQYTVKFRSTVCRSVLYSNIGETGITFEDCVVNQEYVKDFTIWNRSEIPLYWQMNVVDAGNASREEWLRFVDYEDSFGNDVDENVDRTDENGTPHHSRTIQSSPIPSYGYKRIRIIFRPRENGDFLFDLLLENLNDASNIEEVAMHATVRAVSRGEDTLVISTGSTLDFGDCCAGAWTRLPITFTSTSLTPTEIHLKVEGAEVVFDIQTEPGPDVSESEQDSIRVSKPTRDPDISNWYDGSRKSDSSANTDHLEHSHQGSSYARSRLSDWVEDDLNQSSTTGFVSTAPSIADSTGAKTDRSMREPGPVVDSGPSSPVTSEGFFPESAQQIGVNTEKFFPGPELNRMSKETLDDDQESEADSASIQESGSQNIATGYKKRNSLRSISFTGAQREKELAQAQTLGPKSPSRGNQSTTRIEELFLKPGKERTVVVSYRPALDTSFDDFQAGKLVRKSFRIVVSYAPWGGINSSVPFSENAQKDRKIIQCKARACTSFITVEPKAVDFGDTDVGNAKSHHIKLVNQSEIPAIVQLDFQSKVLHCTPTGAITIAPKSATELRLDIFPRKVNPEYRKQLTLLNLTNRANDQIIEVRSTNIDKNRVTFHSLFYRVLFPGGSNFLDFGNVVVGGIGLRMITISNFTRNWLTVEITTSLSGELTVYERAKDHQSYLNLSQVSGLLSTSQDPPSDDLFGAGSIDRSIVLSRGPSPTLGDQGVSQNSSDGSKSSLLPRRRYDHRDTSSTPSEASTPVVIGGASLASTLALRAKAILFHGEMSHTVGTAPANFLDLATNKQREKKKVLRRVPTMRELLEPSSRQKSLSAEKTGKSSTSSITDSSRSPRSQAVGQATASNTGADAGSKRTETSAAPSHRLQDSKLQTPEVNSLKSTESAQPDSHFLNSRSLDNVLATLDASSIAGGSMLFYKAADEERYVKDRMKLARELQNAIATGELAPVSLVSVPPETEHQLFILFTPSSTFRDHIKGIPKKQDARIFLRLVDFDQEAVKNNPQFHALLNNDVSQIPLREIMVRSSLVRSIMDLGQNNINFGTMEKGEKRTKTIVIQNRSKEPLLYHIRKSGSIASGDIVLGTGKSGVVRGYSKKEVDFIFEPSMSGQYHEKLAIENIQDPESSRVLNVKANIRKPEHFSIEVSELDFGSTSIGKKSEPQRVVITNSTKQSRSFEVRVDPREMALLSTEAPVGGQIEFTLEDEAGKAIVTKEMEDEIEILEQKLKIAKRKGRHDKVLKVTARLSLLRKGGVEDKEEPSKAADNSETTLTSDKVQELDKLDQGGSPMAESSAKGTSNSTPTSTAVSTPTAKEGPKFRKTDHSIVFTLEGGKTKSVTAYFTPLQDPASSGIDISNFGQLGLQGKIFVHEHKNRDVYREITFVSKTDCQTMAPDTNPDVNEVPDPTKSEVEQPKEKVERNGDAVKDTTVAQDITVQPSECTSEATQTSEPKHPENLVTSPCELDGGRLEQGHNGTFYFKLSNLSDGPQPYRIELEERPGVEHRVKFEEDMLEGTLEPKEDRRISFGYQAADVGRLYDTLRVVNPLTQTAFDFKFSIYSHRSQYLAFPSLDESMQLDLGHCYVDTGRKYSQVTPLLIENVTDDDVYIACASNLSQQVGIFQDEQAEKGQVSRTLLKKRSMITVWVAVQPNLLGDVLRGNTNRRPAGAVSNTHGSGNNDRDSECRTLVGGIKFSISVQEESVTANEPSTDAIVESPKEEPLTQIASQTVKFTSVIGRSILAVSDTLLHLGWTPDVGKPIYGSFTLYNLSSRLPLDYHVESMCGSIVLDRAGGKLDGWDVESVISKDRASLDTDRDWDETEIIESDQMDRSRIWISFRVTVSTPGLFTDTILVTNKNNCSQKIEIKVRLFVDPKYLLSTAHGPGYVCPMAMDEAVEVQDERHGASREGLCLPRFTWKDVYVNVHEDRPAEGEGSQIYVALQPTSGESEANVERRWIEFTNDSDAPMELVPLCDTGVETRWASETPQEGTEELLTTAEDKAVEGFQFCGQVLRVNPSESAQLLVTCPAPDLDANALELLQCGKNATLNGNLMVMDRLKNQIVKVLSLAATFGISYSEIHPLTSELGKIGHYNSWKPVSAFFEVRNSSEVPLQYEVILQDCMELIEAPTEEDGEPTQDPELRQRPSTKRTISSQNLDKIGVTLYPKRVDNFEIGRRSFPIQVVNLNNPENVLVFTVSALLTEFELGFDRLSGGKLVLPPLTHPLPSGALPCDAWFTITNKSPEDVKFEIGATLSPDIENYVRLEVLSRFSNSPLRGNISLSPRGSIEVRIRAFSREDSRLPSNTAALCTPDGLTFGSLWVATKSTTSEDEPMAMRYAEDIPIRGTLVEGSMFTLSTQRIVFKSLLEASDSEGESDNERLSVPDTLPSREPCDDDINPEIQQAFISITNLSTCFPLDFQLTLEGPMEYPAAEIIKVTPLDANNCGSVEPGQQLKLMVELIDPHVIISEDIKLYIRNLNSKMGQQQRVVISIVSDNREHRKPGKKHVAEDERVDPHHHQNKLDEPVVAGTIGPVFPTQTAVDSDSGTMQPVISLRGCKRMDSSDSPGGRYELDLGQQDMGSPNVLRKLVLENHGFDRVSYRIKTISALDKNWLKVSRFDGTLEPPSYEPLPGGTKSGSSSTNTITLSFSTNVRNVYSTYLLVENVDNPADTKTIRVTMEIVARQNIRRSAKALEADNKVFNVFVNGVDYKNTSSIDMKNLYYGSEYTARSMVVYNREAVPMEFTFKSNLSPSDATEILFSTSRTSAKLFKTLTVPPENHVRIYIRFFPKPSAAIKAALDNGEYRDPNEMELKTVEIYINCRLVKDYQHVVVLKAECYLPALRVDWQDSVSFVARLSRKPTTTQESSDEWQITFREDYRILGIQNLLNMPLEYQIVNDTMYFTLEYTELDKVVDGMQLHHIRIVPNVKALLRNAENFRKEKYVQENITIYNRRRPLENYWIPLRLSFGNVSNFQLSSGYKSSYAFGMIEQHVVNFLSDFNSHAVLVNMGNTTGSALADAHSNIGLGPDRNVQLPTANNLSPSSSSPILMSGAVVGGGLSLLMPTTSSTMVLPSGPLVAGMLGLGRAGGVYGPPPQHQHHAHLQATEALDAQRKLIDLEFQYHYVVDQLVYYSTIKTGENFFQLAGLLFCSLLSNRIFQIWSPAYLKDPRTNESATGTAAGGAGAASGTSGATGLGPDSDDPQPQPQPQQQQTQQQQQSQQQQQPGANGVTTASHARLPQDGEQVIRVWPESLRKWVEALDYFVSFFPYHSRQLETLKALHHSLISS